MQECLISPQMFSILWKAADQRSKIIFKSEKSKPFEFSMFLKEKSG